MFIEMDVCIGDICMDNVSENVPVKEIPVFIQSKSRKTIKYTDQKIFAVLTI